MRSGTVWLVGTLVMALSLVSCGGNGAPESTQYSVTIKLEGTVQDETLPRGPLTLEWTKVSGPGPVVFADPSLSDTTATFFDPGIFILRLTASDAEFTVSDDVEITIEPPEQTSA